MRAAMVAGGGAVLVSGLVAASVQAEEGGPASGTWTLDAEGTVRSSGTITFRTTFNGVPGVEFTCSLKLSGEIPSPAPTAAPGETIEIEQAPPPVLSSSDPSDPEYNKCSDMWADEAADVTSNAEPWTLEVTTPATASASPWDGPLVSVLRVPAGAITYSFAPVVCTLTLPKMETAFTGSYNSATGTAAASTSPLQVVTVGKTGNCTVGYPTRLVEATATLDPVVDLVYTP